VIVEGTLLRKLETTAFRVRRARAGRTAGDRRSTKHGSSVEFADYRNYTRGDDLRRVDWNVYARLERPFVKLFDEEEDLAVHLLLDGSASMDWGGEGEHKWRYALRLAAALGYVALTAGDRLSVGTLRAASVDQRFGPVRGRGNALRLFDWLEGRGAVGTTDLDAALRGYALSGGRAGLVVLISDLFSPPGYAAGLTALAARGHELTLVHVLSPDEVEPPLAGDLRLLDVETGDPQEVTIDGRMRTLYRRRLLDWQEEARTTCRRRDALYVPVQTSTPLERLLLRDLRRVGLLR
jgi:uncharacterized protein (DUF58 family)